MPSLNAGELENCLLQKLEASELQGSHRKFEIFNDRGQLVARTAMSRSWRGNTSISDDMVNNIKKQLHLPRSVDLMRLIQCTMSRTEYLALVDVN